MRHKHKHKRLTRGNHFCFTSLNKSDQIFPQFYIFNNQILSKYYVEIIEQTHEIKSNVQILINNINVQPVLLFNIQIKRLNVKGLVLICLFKQTHFKCLINLVLNSYFIVKAKFKCC